MEWICENCKRIIMYGGIPSTSRWQEWQSSDTIMQQTANNSNRSLFHHCFLSRGGMGRKLLIAINIALMILSNVEPILSQSHQILKGLSNLNGSNPTLLHQQGLSSGAAVDHSHPPAEPFDPLGPKVRCEYLPLDFIDCDKLVDHKGNESEKNRLGYGCYKVGFEFDFYGLVAQFNYII
jgi:hypothetical protein